MWNAVLLKITTFAENLQIVCSDGTVLKRYVIFDSMTQKNIHNLLALSKIRKMYHISELAMPLEIFREDNKVVGYTMPFCPGVLLDEAIEDSSFSPYEIMNAFVDLATVTERLPRRVFIGDLHGQNVLVSVDKLRFFV